MTPTDSIREIQARTPSIAADRRLRDVTLLWHLLTGLLLLVALMTSRAQAADPNFPGIAAPPAVQASDLPTRVADEALDSAIRSIISAQLDAFKRDDGAEAFSYASPDIRRKFGNPQIFMQMVQSGYSAIYRPAAVEFGELKTLRGQPAQTVSFIGQDGRSMVAVYVMEQQPDGSWLIDGVFLIEADDEMA